MDLGDIAEAPNDFFLTPLNETLRLKLGNANSDIPQISLIKNKSFKASL